MVTISWGALIAVMVLCACLGLLVACFIWAERDK